MAENPTLNGSEPSSPENGLFEGAVAERRPVGINFQNMLALMGETYFELDLSGRFTFFNEYVCFLLGRSERELRQIDYRDYLVSADANRVYSVYRHVYRTGIPSPPFEYDVIRKDGSRATIETAVDLLLDESGNAVGFCGISRDVSAKKKAEKALRESEKKYRRMIENMVEGYYETDLEGCFTYANASVWRSLGYDPDGIVGLSFRQVVDPSSVDNIFQLFNEAYREKLPVQTFECDLVRKDGGTLTQEVSVSLLYGASGKPVGFYGVARDRTEFRQMERTIREREENYRHILACAPYSISIVRISDWRFVQVNDTFCQRTGYSADEVIGRTTEELNVYADPEDRERLRQAVKAHGAVDGLEMQHRSKSGEKIESLLSGRRTWFQGEECFLVITAEITQLKETERALAKSEEKYRNILGNMEEGYYEVDLRGTFTFVNRSMGTIHGYPPEQLPGMNYQAFTRRENQKRIFDIFNKVYRTGVPAKVLDYEVIREDGQMSVLETSASLLRDADGKPTGFYGISRDITERRKAEKELARYRERLEELVHERTKELESAQKELVKREKLAVLGQITATVSHELRNPLGVIRSSNYYLQKKLQPADSKAEKHFKRIEEQVSVCDTIVDDLLEFTRGRSLMAVSEDVNSWLPEVLERHREKTGVSVDCRLAGGLSPIPHDREKMKRAVSNLLDNAMQAVSARRDAMENQGADYSPEIRVETVGDGPDTMIVISDNGIGMDETTRENIFEPLFTTRARGTGIGLSIVWKIVEEHGGQIGIDSAPGKGTRATIRLPGRVRSVED